MSAHRIVSHDKWVEARRKFLALEKAFTRERDALSRKRRELPWEKVEKKYVFDAAKPPVMLNTLRLPTIGRIWQEFGARAERRQAGPDAVAAPRFHTHRHRQAEMTCNGISS